MSNGRDDSTHFDAALIGTASDTLSAIGLLAAVVSFLPPIAEYAVAAVAKSVPRVRYSVLMARPKMTLCVKLVRCLVSGNRRMNTY